MKRGVLLKMWAFLIRENFLIKGVSEAMEEWRVSRDCSVSAEMIL
jgi:hypothetical protein